MQNDPIRPRPPLVDAHCHLLAEEFADGPGPVLEEGRGVGIVRFVTAAVLPEEWNPSLALARAHPDVSCVLGVHPWYCGQTSPECLKDLPAALERGAAGVGEIGLDTVTDRCPFDVQRVFFCRQLAVAREMNLPVVLHCRKAFNETLEVLKREGAPARGGLVHSFAGSAEIAEAFLEYGFMFSLGGILTYRNSPRRTAALRRIYPDALLLETDAPDIPPVERHGLGPNTPANILYNLRAASEMLEVSEDEIAHITTKNAEKLFGFRREPAF